MLIELIGISWPQIEVVLATKKEIVIVSRRLILAAQLLDKHTRTMSVKMAIVFQFLRVG
jgi:hypothetical protein